MIQALNFLMFKMLLACCEWQVIGWEWLAGTRIARNVWGLAQIVWPVRPLQWYH